MISNVSIEMEKVLFRSAHKTKSQIDLKHSDGSISQRTGDQKLAKNDSNLIKRFLQLHKLMPINIQFGYPIPNLATNSQPSSIRNQPSVH